MIHLHHAYIRTVSVGLIIALTGCANSFQPRQGKTLTNIDKELGKAITERKPVKESDAVAQALVPPVVIEMPKLDSRPMEPRFDLSVVNAPAAQVLTAIVQGSRYSMVVHPNIKENISVSLKDVTVPEAMEIVREMYGFEFQIQNNRIMVQAPAVQTRIFQVNYLTSQRRGRSDVRVTSGAISDMATPGTGVPGATGAIPGQVPGAIPGTALPGQTTQSQLGSRVTTTSDSDFWKELGDALRAIVGNEPGRQVVLNPQSGVLVVRAMPHEMRAVDQYLRSTRVVVERQVMLEAKIIEVELSDGYQAGVNWSSFRSGDNSRAAGGLVAPGTDLRTSGSISTPTTRGPDGSVLSTSILSATPGTPGLLSAGTGVPGSILGLAFQTSNFATLLNFLQTQGNLQVLSSPRIAAINNQKAVLKVGNDEFFVTNVTTTVVSGVGGTTQAPSIQVQPFFSGVALDVTPQIDENNQIILHIHPSVSSVVERVKNIDLGTSGNFRLPLASSTISETDTIVRVQDGNIVAIGGLMRETQRRDRSGVPGLAGTPVIGSLFRSTSRSARKSELVILIKPTIIQGDADAQKDLEDIRERMQSYDRADAPRSRSIWGDGAIH